MTPADFAANLRAEMARLRMLNPGDVDVKAYHACNWLAHFTPKLPGARVTELYFAAGASASPEEAAELAAALGCPVDRLTVSREQLEAKCAGLSRQVTEVTHVADTWQKRCDRLRGEQRKHLDVVEGLRVLAKSCLGADPVEPAEHERLTATIEQLAELGTLRARVAELEGSLNVMTALWQAAEEEMRSDDPVEVRLRQDIDDADLHAQKLAARVAELEARICEVAKWKAANDARAAELSFLDDPEDWAPCVGSVADLAEIIDLAAVEVRV